MNRYQVIFQPGNVAADVLEGATIMETINETGLDFDSPCGGRGKCGKCRVRIFKGAGQPTAVEQEILAAEELAQGVRLACLTRIHGEMAVELPNSKKLEHHILSTAEERYFRVEPHLKKIFIEVGQPSLHDQRSDWHRVRDSLAEYGYNPAELEAPVSELRQLPGIIRETKHRLTAIMHGSQVLGMETQDTTKTMFGMAFDIGTTTIVGYLLDLYSGNELSVVSTLDPQTKFGADVISRITLVNQDEGGLNKLHTAVVQAINKLIGEATAKAGVNRSDIYAVSIAANTVMHHLFLGVSPRNIATAPYVPAISEPLVVDSSDLQININRGGQIFILPNIAGFVGADTTAVLLATELDRSENIKLVIDIGTNGEIALGSREQVVACSAAAGPAFEGAQISSGMRGAVGAIDHVYFGEQLEYSVIGGGNPLGICGSALLDAVAGLLELGIIDQSGRFLRVDKLSNPAALRYKDNIIQHEGLAAFLMAEAGITGHGRPIMITQRDIRELQLAKGAMAAGISILLEATGIRAGDIEEVLLAGAFGNYLNPHSACAIGLIPPELESKIKMIGNAAGTGAKIALLSGDEYRRAADIAEFVEYVELGSYPGFSSIFAKAMYFR